MMYNWKCNSLTAKDNCELPEKKESNPNLKLLQSNLKQGVVYNFTLQIWENTVLRGACSARVEVVGQK